MVPVPPVSTFPVPEMANVAAINATTQTAKVKKSGLDDAILLGFRIMLVNTYAL